MSVLLEHDISRDIEGIQSLFLEKNIPSLNPLAAVGISAQTLPDQPPQLVEATDFFSIGHFADGLFHQHRTLVTLPLMQGLIYGGAFGLGNNVRIVTLPPISGATGYYRAYFRVRGICPLVPWGVAGVDVQEYKWHLNPYGWEVALRIPGANGFTGNFVSQLRFNPHPHRAAVGATDFIVNSSLILNRTADETSVVPLGAWSIDRIVGFSIAGNVGADIFAAYRGKYYLGRSVWYESPPNEDIFTPSATPPPSFFGTGLRNVPLGTTDLMWRNDLGINPPSLLPPYDPMIPVAIGTPQLTNYVEIQFIGYRPEASARTEEIIDLASPILVTDLP